MSTLNRGATRHRYLKNVATLELDETACTGCGMCLQVCPHAVFAENASGKPGAPVRIVDRDACMECGACMENCAAGAVTVKKGVGCAYAIIMGKLLGTEPTCGCGSDGESGVSGCC